MSLFELIIMFLGKCWNNSFKLLKSILLETRIIAILSTWHFIKKKKHTKEKSKQLCYFILFAPQENWFCLSSLAPCILWKCRLVCMNYCILCTRALKVLKGVYFVLEGSVCTLNDFCWTVKMSFHFYCFVLEFFVCILTVKSPHVLRKESEYMCLF